MIISGIAFFIIRGLMTIYGRCWEPEEITATQLEELAACVINQDPIEALAAEKRRDASSV